MEIIGAGFGRTWTMSLRAALEELGYGPCYHFREVILHPGHIATWQRAADGQPVDWRTSFLKDYRAVLDYPAVSFLDDIRAAFPEAKVILTDRDPDIRVRDRPVRFEGQVLFSDPAPGRDPARWYHNALLAALVLNILPPWRGFYKMLQSSNLGRVFHGRFEDRARAIAVYQKHMPSSSLPFPPSNCWSLRSSRVGSRCVRSSARRYRISPSRTSTTARKPNAPPFSPAS